MSQTPASAEPKLSPVEVHKEHSRHLRGTVSEELASADHFSDANKSLIKFHGTYQQEDRDARKARRKDGVGKHYMFMVRCKIPSGRLTAKQYLDVDDLAQQYANGTLRFTSRQGIQLHGIVMGDLKATIAGINDCLLTTLGACGDVERNVMSCPAVFDPVRRQLNRWANLIAEHLAPRTRAYHEIWLNGEKVDDDGNRIEPIYGKVYLPRKFKTGLGLTSDNCIDLYAQDLGFLALTQGSEIVGYNVTVGGGMGMTHGNANTFPFIAQPICYIEPGDVVLAAESVIKLFRDHGNRADRKRARIKYLVHDWGADKFREMLRSYFPKPVQMPKPAEIIGFDLHLGWRQQDDGRWCLGISVENGRVKDDGSMRMRSALRMIAETIAPGFAITAQQDVLLHDIPAVRRAEIDRILVDHGVTCSERISLLQQYSMACPAIPTCGLAISESERALPAIVDELESVVCELQLDRESIGIRMTGCPNGCVRPYQSDIGIVGRSGDKYTIYVGGHVLGTRLNFELKDLVPRPELVPTLTTVLRKFKAERQGQESFGDYCHRVGRELLHAAVQRVG